MTTIPNSFDLAASRKTVRTLDDALTQWDARLKADLAAKEAEKKRRDPLDELEEKLMRNTAIAAAASGTPEQAKDMLAKARSKAMRAAADGADTGALEAMVRQMEHLAKVAEENRQSKQRARPGENATGTEGLPLLAAQVHPQL